MVLELPTTTASTRLELIGLLFSVLPKKNGTPITMCFASIFSFVFVALLAIAFSTDNWQNIAFKTPVPTEVGLFQSQINEISTNKPQMVMSIVEKSLGY